MAEVGKPCRLRVLPQENVLFVYKLCFFMIVSSYNYDYHYNIYLKNAGQSFTYYVQTLAENKKAGLADEVRAMSWSDPLNL